MRTTMLVALLTIFALLQLPNRLCAEDLYVTNDGVAIGTDDPEEGADLEVYRADTEYPAIALSQANGSYGSGALLTIENSEAATSTYSGSVILAPKVYAGGGSPSYQYDTNALVVAAAGTSGSEEGYVGIGTNDPQEKLDVRGPSRIASATDDDEDQATLTLFQQGEGENGEPMAEIIVRGENQSSGDKERAAIRFEAVSSSSSRGGKIIFATRKNESGPTDALDRISINAAGDLTLDANTDGVDYEECSMLGTDEGTTTVSCQDTSSIEFKRDVLDYNEGLDVVKALRPVTYYYKDEEVQLRAKSSKLHVGLIAEEVHAVEPLLTSKRSDGSAKGVKYAFLTTVLINAIKDQQAQIEDLQARIEALE